MATESKADVDVCRWIFEFLLRQPLDYSLLTSLSESLPLPSNNFSLSKTKLLREIRHHLSTSASAATILPLLYQLQQLHYANGFPDMPPHFKAAYFQALALDFVDFLESNKGKSAKKRYYEEMKNTWKWRVSKGALFREVGLVAKEFLEWKDAVVAMMKGGDRGFENVRVYVDKEMDKSTPSFLETVAANHAAVSAVNARRNQVDKGDSVDVSRAVVPVAAAESGVVALGETIEDLPTPERKEGRLRDSSSSADNVASCKQGSEVKTKRRQSKRWSTEEEDALRDAVVKYGKGNWKFILYAYQHIFLERTEVDLKDKWRNLSRN